MNKIERALEKSRALTGNDTRAPFRGRPGRRTPATGFDPIVYRQTAVVNVPRDYLLKQHIVGAFAQHELADTFRILRTQVIRRMAPDGATTLAITSPSRGEGKTLTAINLAASLSMQMATTVLLVDIDLRRPSIGKTFGLKYRYGLMEYLLGDVPLSKCLINPGVERLVILPAGGAIPISSELLSSPKMLELIDELKNRYENRIIIYDCPPLLISDDTLTFLQHVDGCLLVFREGQTRKKEIKQCRALLNGYNVLGTVLNDSSEVERQASYYGP